MSGLLGRMFLARNHSAFIPIGRNFSYKSDLSLDRLYPNSRLLLCTPPPLDSLTKAGKFTGYIPMEEMKVTYSRAGGPGGQNVNRVDTKVDLRFHVNSATWITEATKEKLNEKYKTRISKEGYFIVKSDLTRYQHMNLADALEKLRNIIRLLENTEKVEPTEESIALETKRREKAARARLIAKRHKSILKNARKTPDYDV